MNHYTVDLDSRGASLQSMFHVSHLSIALRGCDESDARASGFNVAQEEEDTRALQKKTSETRLGR